MRPRFDLQNLLVSIPGRLNNEYESFVLLEEEHPYIKTLKFDFAIEDENGKVGLALYGEKIKVNPVGRLCGELIYGFQAYEDGYDIPPLCDEYSGDLCVVATDLENDDLLEDAYCGGNNVFYIHTLELSREVVDAPNLQEFFDLIPRLVYLYAGVMPQVCCYLAEAVDGYYALQEKKTEFDPRSAGEGSIQLFLDRGYRFTTSRKLLYIHCEDKYMQDDDDTADERVLEPEDKEACEGNARFGIQETNTNEIGRMEAEAGRRLLEDYVQVGFPPSIVHISRNMPDKLIRYVQAAIIAHNAGTPFDYALKYFVPSREPDIAAIHLAFQEMYFAGERHMKETVQRMNLEGEPNAGELFADIALTRARNTYYVAGLLYREGHMIEAHAMSRLMLEQIAWAFSACSTESEAEAEKIRPPKAIGPLKKKIKEVGRLYGALSDYVHLPLKGHYEFIDISDGKNAIRYQFGEHSYMAGQVIAVLADYWACVYEYAQARHFGNLENWVSGSSDFDLNPERPFLGVINPIREELSTIYESEYPSCADYLRKSWTPPTAEKSVDGVD